MKCSVLCVFALVALPVGGCSEETTAAGGSGGDGGTGDMGGDGGTGGMGGMPECPDDCADSNDCTDDTCLAGVCEFAPVADGTACDESNECTTGTCADGTCDSPPVADGTACTGGECLDGVCAREGAFSCTEQGIRDAIVEGGGPHFFACDGTTPVVTEAEIFIHRDVILDGEGNLAVDGNEDHRVFSVAPGVTAELRGLTVTRGVGGGGGIFNQGGTVTLTNSTVSGNTGGAGIFDRGTLTLTNSTVSGNSSDGGGAGGIFNQGGTVTLTNSTVSGNTGGLVGGIFNQVGTVTLMNSLVDGDCGGLGDIISNGYNIESPGDTCGFDQGTDQFFVTEGQLNLGPLQDNGGPTMTHALLPGSVAIDMIPADMCDVTEDQRGVTRPQGAMCDVGAFELEQP